MHDASADPRIAGRWLTYGPRHLAVIAPHPPRPAANRLPNIRYSDTRNERRVGRERTSLLARALHQPRVELAGVQCPRAGRGRGPDQPAVGAGEVPVDLQLEPRRVLHGPRGRACASRPSATAPRRTTRPTACGPITQLQRIAKRTQELVAAQYRCWNESVLPQLAEAGHPHRHATTS